MGGFFPGWFEYATATYVSEQPTGPFRPDYPAFRLNGYSGRDLVALWAAYCRVPGDLLLSNYMLDSGGAFWWHAPLKSAVVDGAGHLRMGYWKGNEALKGAALSWDAGRVTLESHGAGNTLETSEGGVKLIAPPAPQVRWITPGKPNIAVVLNDTAFDFDQGCIVEASFKVTARDGLVFPAAGICLEQKRGEGTAILFETWAQTEIGKLYWSGEPVFESRDITGNGCATVAGIPAGEAGQVRLLIRKGIFEIYLNDLLVQTYAADTLTGRIGFVVQDGQGEFSRLKAWAMELP